MTMFRSIRQSRQAASESGESLQCRQKGSLRSFGTLRLRSFLPSPAGMPCTQQLTVGGSLPANSTASSETWSARNPTFPLGGAPGHSRQV